METGTWWLACPNARPESSLVQPQWLEYPCELLLAHDSSLQACRVRQKSAVFLAGESGMAYPVVSLTGNSITLNEDNGIDITGATFSGTAYNASGITTTLQPADGPGGAGAASSGSPGIVGACLTASVLKSGAPSCEAHCLVVCMCGCAFLLTSMTHVCPEPLILLLGYMIGC